MRWRGPFIILSIINILLFQSCGRYAPLKFAVPESFDLSSTSASTPEALFEKGQKLYATNCAACHAPLTSSTKKNRTAAQIQDAMQIVGAMSSLKRVLSEQDIFAIEKALDSRKPGDLDPHLNFACDANSMKLRGITQSLIKRFTKQEMVNTLQSLLGTTIFSDSVIQTELAKITPDIISKEPTDIPYSASSFYFSSLYNSAKRAADLIMANATEKERVLGACASQSPVTETCVKNFVNNYGLLVYRRPVTASEISSHWDLWTKIINNSASTTEAFKGLIIKFLSSPEMSFHIELGTSVIADGRTRLSPYEVASRISYMAAATMPDQALLEAAKNGSLDTISGVRQQVLRILAANQSSMQKTDELISYYGGFENIETPYAPSALGRAIDLEQLPQEMKQEALEFSRYAIWNKKSTFAGLMTSSDVFPRSDRMSKILDTPKVTGNTPAQAPAEYSGFFLRPGFLTSAYDRTPIIRRGIRMREKVFCSLGEGNPATAEQIDQAKKNVPDLANLTNRDAVTAITSATACISCHAKFNPAGFLFESYDQLGKFRTVESIFDSSGNVVKTYPINTRVDNTGFETLPQPAKDAMEMVQDIGQSNNARACFAMKIMTFYRVATPDIAIDNCTLNEIYKSTATGTVLEVIATAIANEDIFWKKTGN